MNKNTKISWMIPLALIIGFTSYKAIAATASASTGVGIENPGTLTFTTQNPKGCRGLTFPEKLKPASRNNIGIQYHVIKKVIWPSCHTTYTSPGAYGDAQTCTIIATNNKGQLTWNVDGSCAYSTTPFPQVSITASS